MFVGANFSMLLQDYYIHTLTDGVPTIGFTYSCHFLDKVLFCWPFVIDKGKHVADSQLVLG